MGDSLILMGTLALVIERWTEIWMNTVKATFGEPPPGQNSQQVIYRVVALAIGVVTGLIVASMTQFDVFKVAFPGATIQNGLLITGIVMGLGAAPTHEVVKYIEEKKNKAKAEKKLADKVEDSPPPQVVAP